MSRILLVALFLLAGCAGDLASPTPQDTDVTSPTWLIAVTPGAATTDMMNEPDGRYPLQLGNTWKHRAHVSVRTIPDEGEPSEEEFVRVTKAEITGESSWFDRCYIVEERTITEDEGDPVTQFVHYRQDRAGLYEVAESTDGPTEGAARHGAPGLPFALDLSTQRNPGAWARALTSINERMQPLYQMRNGRGRGGAIEGELTRLQYPLRHGQEWVVIDDAFFMSSHVEGRVVLDLPIGRTAAWKVRIESTLFGPDDQVHFFYGRDGYLGWQVSVVGDVLAESGERIGTVLFTDEEYLEELSIDRRAELPCSAVSQGGRRDGATQAE